jgi:hypothetical protein
MKNPQFSTHLFFNYIASDCADAASSPFFAPLVSSRGQQFMVTAFGHLAEDEGAIIFIGCLRRDLQQKQRKTAEEE